MNSDHSTNPPFDEETYRNRLETLFADPENWAGGHYELAIEIAPASDALLDVALHVLWQHDSLAGCYANRDVKPSLQPHVSPTSALREDTAEDLTGNPIESSSHVYGFAALPNKALVPCGCSVIREEDGSDWLNFYLPMAALAQIYDTRGYPFSANDGLPQPQDEWRTAVDAYLLDLCRYVHSRAPFALALIGLEVSGTANARDTATNGIPAQRWMGYAVPSETQLSWHAPTEAGDWFT